MTVSKITNEITVGPTAFHLPLTHERAYRSLNRIYMIGIPCKSDRSKCWPRKAVSATTRANRGIVAVHVHPQYRVFVGAGSVLERFDVLTSVGSRRKSGVVMADVTRNPEFVFSVLKRGILNRGVKELDRRILGTLSKEQMQEISALALVPDKLAVLSGREAE